MESHFSSEFFAANRRRLRELFMGTAPIVIAGNGLMQRGGDSTYAFQQDANFWYLTGIEEPDIVLVMDRDREYLIVPSRSASREAFDGMVTTEDLVRRSGIQTVLNDKEGWEQLGGRLKKVKHVATIAAPPAYIEQYGFYTNPGRASVLTRLKSCNAGIELLDLSQHLVHMRMVKQEPELGALRQAIDVTVRGMKAAFRPSTFATYAYEFELEADISRSFRLGGGNGHAFTPIVASGQRACTLHYVTNNGAFAKGELVVVDVGAEVEHYAADITRTRSIGPPSRRQQAVHAAVLAAQQFAFDQLKPGTILRNYEHEVALFLGEKLRELGLIKTISDDSIREFCPHATSHFLGLVVHDVGDYNRPLEPGMVLTVEPGIYIAKEGIGVRIEDDVVVTEQGIRILTDALPRDLV